MESARDPSVSEIGVELKGWDGGPVDVIAIFTFWVLNRLPTG